MELQDRWRGGSAACIESCVGGKQGKKHYFPETLGNLDSLFQMKVYPSSQ